MKNVAALMCTVLASIAGCAVEGPSVESDGSRAKVGFNSGSTISLKGDGDWSGSSVQPSQQSGTYITDEQQSAIMPGNATSIRASSKNLGVLSGADVRWVNLEILFAENQVEGSEPGRSLERVGGDLDMSSAEFYETIRNDAGVRQAVTIALGDDATAQKIAQLETLKAVTPNLTDTARAVVDAILDRLVPDVPLPSSASAPGGPDAAEGGQP